jgi:hypothetical protein
MIYYRVALQMDQSSLWKWRSNPLTSLNTLVLFLRTYGLTSTENVRVFFSSSAESMEEMLTRENQGLASTSITAKQLLTNGGINSWEVNRLEMELCSVGDHDMPYTFSLPTNWSETQAWIKLLQRVRSGELQS